MDLIAKLAENERLVGWSQQSYTFNYLSEMATQLQPNSHEKLVFGPFEYYEGSGELRKHSTRLRLQGQPLRILSVLLDRPGQVVSRAEMQRILWGGTTFIDFEQGLNAAVNKLRQTLGDSADQPRYIETLPGQGYRFIAPIRRVAASQLIIEIAPPLPVQTNLPITARLRPMWPLAAGAMLLAVAAGSFWLGAQRAGNTQNLKPVQFAVSPPVGFALEAAASRQSFALSPDGTRLAFTAMDSSGAFSLFLRELNGQDSRLVPNTRGAHTVFWPADSRSMFATVRGKLLRLPLEGDAHVVISESSSYLFSGVEINPSKLFHSNHAFGTVVSPSGGKPSQHSPFNWPQMLPDGTHILYVAWHPKSASFMARVSEFDGTGPAQDLVESQSRVMYAESVLHTGTGYLMYLRAGNLLAHPFDPKSRRLIGEAIPIASKVYSFSFTGAADFSVSQQGTLAYQKYVSRSQLVWVDRQGNQVGTIGPPNSSVKAGRLSPDGQKFASVIYDVEQGAQDIWIFDIASGAKRKLSSTPWLRDAPAWSPDSQRLAFLSGNRDAFPGVRIRALEEKAVEEDIPGDGFQMPTDWSPNGRFVLFANTGVPTFANEKQSDVMVADMANGKKVTPLLDTPFHEANPIFSPDGKWLAFTSNESGQAELYIQAFESSEKPRLVGERFPATKGGALALRWRRDGKELFHLGFNGKVYATPVNLSKKPSFGTAQALFTISTEARAAIHSLNGFDVSADGQRFVIPVTTTSENPSLIVIQNWEIALLPKL